MEKNHPTTKQGFVTGKRFSIKEFFKIAEPETAQWNKLYDDYAAAVSALTTEHKESDNPAKSAVRGMTKAIDLIILSEELESGEHS